MTQRADNDAKRAALITHICALKDADFNALRVTALAEKFDVYWKVAQRQMDIETQRRRARAKETPNV